MVKIPKNKDDDNNTNRVTIQLASAAIIINKRIATPITVEFRPNQRNSNLNVAKAHRIIFSALKTNNPTLKM